MNTFSYHHSIHCLSNGSEYTDATLLLTIERGTTFCQRYALTGLTSLSARLAADQKVALHTIQACFGGGGNVGGLASLLLCQSQAGVGEVTVCSSDSKQVDSIVSLTLGRRAFPLVRTCEVPRDGKWYRMYKDDFLVAHGKFVQNNQMLWIFSLLKKSDITSFAVLPNEDAISLMQPPFPAGASEFEFYIILEKPKGPPPVEEDGKTITRYYYTHAAAATDDAGLLMRASRQAKRLSEKLPFCVSFRGGGASPLSQQEQQQQLDTSCCNLETCFRLRLDDDDASNADSLDEDSHIDRAYRKTREPAVLYDDEKELDDHDDIKAIWSGRSGDKDANEIDIDDDDENDEESGDERPSVPHLLVLGTGCATPAALRGSSGYALLTLAGNNDLSLTAIIDCGEGTLTNLHRHLPSALDDQLKNIRFIWISHAHLDHYGGLPDLVIAMYKARHEKQQEECTNDDSHLETKKRKLVADSPVIIAPHQVLDYLSVSLNGSAESKWYRGVTHNDFQKSPFAQDVRDFVGETGQLVNIRVEHCAQAYGMMLTLKNSSGFRLCYSGDTRPSNNLVRACQGVSLLIHEATFDETDRRLVVQKKHSTVLEALDVAKRMKAHACLLTHFSQRYPKSPPGSDTADAAFAVDGLMIPLTLAAVKKLPALSRLIQQALVETKPLSPTDTSDTSTSVGPSGSILI